MRLLFFGDVVGRSGRTALLEQMPGLIETLKADFTIVNGENAASGFGLTTKIANELFEAGADCITLGNHAWDQRDLLGEIDAEPRIIRPVNFPQGTPGRGSHIYETHKGKRVLVINVMGRVFMDALDDPFRAVGPQLDSHKLGRSVDAVVVDVHAEATSEKMAMGHFCDGRASLVVGTHSHVPTADAQVLPDGTAYQTDAGMCGDYDSVIGMEKTEPIRRFITKTPGKRFEPASGPATVCGVLVETDDATGLAESISPVRIGGRLKEIIPIL